MTPREPEGERGLERRFHVALVRIAGWCDGCEDATCPSTIARTALDPQGEARAILTRLRNVATALIESGHANDPEVTEAIDRAEAILAKLDPTPLLKEPPDSEVAS